MRAALAGAARGGLLALCLGGAVLAAPGGPPQDGGSDEREAEEEWREAEGNQGQGGEPGHGGQQPGGVENPLIKILELMEQVEQRLFESDTGDFTQEEQRQIAEALRFEGKTTEALEELIRKIEEEQQKQQQSSSSSQDQQDQKQRQQQQQNETEEQRKERERREQERQRREREQERQRQAQQREQQQQHQQQPNDNRRQMSEQERREGSPPEDSAGDPNDPNRASGRWGQLPRKLHQDAMNARNQEPPGRWRDLIERYRTRLAEESR